jgi:flagellar hook-associated protein FlgK
LADLGGAHRQSLIVHLESQRIICDVQRKSLTRAIDSPNTKPSERQALISRRDDLTREMEEIESSLRLLRDEQKSELNDRT